MAFKKKKKFAHLILIFLIPLVIVAFVIVKNVDKIEASDKAGEIPKIYSLSGDVNQMIPETDIPEGMGTITKFVPDKNDSEKYMLEGPALAMNSMLAAAKQAGLEIMAANGYIADGSEHQTGLAADVTSRKVGYQIARKFGETAEGKWIAENCCKYGFIVRYPPGRKSSTGIEYNPCHLRYVGSEAAKYIKEKGFTLEEYFELVNEKE